VFWRKEQTAIHAVDVIEHYGGAIGVHPSITNGLLAKHTGGVFDEVNWRLTYTDSQIQDATLKGKEKMLARMFLNRVDRAEIRRNAHEAT
jgi:hypothetical protein